MTLKYIIYTKTAMSIHNGQRYLECPRTPNNSVRRGLAYFTRPKITYNTKQKTKNKLRINSAMNVVMDHTTSHVWHLIPFAERHMQFGYV
jgi:hypothetical protein